MKAFAPISSVTCNAAIWITLAAGIATGLPARAADTSPGVAIGGVVSLPAGAVVARSTEVSLKGDAARIAMEVTVAAGASARLGLRTPLFAWEGDAAHYPDRQFPELAVTADSTPVSLDSVPRAAMGRADVTVLLAQAGLDPLAIAGAPPVVVAGRDRAAFDRLAALGAVTRLGDVYLAKWSAQRLVSWPAGRAGEHRIVLSYRARPGFGLTDLATLERSVPLSAFCLRPGGLAAALHEAGSAAFVARDYVIPVGVGGRTGALTVHVDAPFAAFCGAGGKAVAGVNAGGLAQADAEGVLRVLTLGPPGS